MTYFLNRTLEHLKKAPIEERLRFSATMIEAAQRRDTSMANRMVLLQTAHQLIDQVVQEIFASMAVMGVAPIDAGPNIADNVIRLMPKKKES